MKKNTNYTKSLPEGWEITIAESIEGIEAIRPIWEQMQSRQENFTIDADIDRFISVIESLEGKAQPYVIVFSYQGKPVAMVIANIQTYELEISFGYKNLFKPKLKCLVLAYGGILGQINSGIGSLMVRVLMKQMKSGKFDMVYLNRLRENSQMFNLSRKIPGILCRDYVPESEVHWQTTGLNCGGEFRKTLSRNERRNISRHTKQLEKKASGQVELKIYKGLDGLDEYISKASEISSLTYQKMITGGFSDNFQVRTLLTKAAQKDWLRAYILYAGSEPVAYELGLLYNSIYFAGYRGFHPEWTCGSPGSVLLLKVLEELSNDSDAEKYDYGFGDAVYKQRYGHENWNESLVYIFAPRFYPVLINLIRTFIKSLEIFVKSILKKFGFIDKVKRYWRKRLEQKAINETKSKSDD